METPDPSRRIKDSHHKTLEESEENDAVDPKKLQYLEIQKNWSGSKWKLSAIVHHTRESKHEMLEETEWQIITNRSM